MTAITALLTLVLVLGCLVLGLLEPVAAYRAGYLLSALLLVGCQWMRATYLDRD